jgi:transcriptional regulator with XRE-family HTH domain
MPRPARATPAELTPGWPVEASPDSVAEVARRFALALGAAVGQQSLRSVAAAAGMSHTSLSAILAGAVWPDLATIAKLERGLGADLWPGRS